MKRILTTLVILAFGVSQSANAAPLSGTKSIGPTGDYASITSAIAAIQAQSLSGALVLELQAAYVSNVETFPLTIPALNGASATNTVTVRPQPGATGLSISSADTIAATVDLNGAQFLIIDGRPGGVGSNAGSGGGAASQLTIANTSTAGVALRFINEASNNIIRYATVRGVNTSAASGTVVFSYTTGANGNDNNTIDHCDIGDGASTPTNGIFSLGILTTAKNNSGNTISNCNVFNFYSVTSGLSGGKGVALDNGNTDWIITGNSFYQTASRPGVTATVIPIYINTASWPGNNFIVTGNFIGGSAPNAGGSAWTTTGTASYYFQGIRLNVGTTTPSSVQGNTIANIVWTSSNTTTSLPGTWSGIYVEAGSANIGTVVGNIIGSGTGTSSVTVTTTGDGGTFGIGAASSGTRVIANNTVGSITVNCASTSVSASLTGIQVAAGTNIISNNLVGSTTSANSLNAATSSTSTFTSQRVTGILSSSTTITGNTVANLNNNSVQTTNGFGQIRGILTSAGVNTISGNTVCNLSTTSHNPNSTTAQSVYGIIDTSTTAGQTISQNSVHSLINTAASAAVSVTGIYFTGQTNVVSFDPSNFIARNWVHSLAVASTSTSSAVNGMYFAAGTFAAQNNMVRVGLDAAGSSTAEASIVRGIYDNGTTPVRNFFHNSVYLGGTQTSTPSSDGSYALQSTGSTNYRTFKNNIFVNARSNSGGTGRHYAVIHANYYLGSNLTEDGNIFLASGNGGTPGFFITADPISLSAWQSVFGRDANSAVADARFIDPTGTAATVDLHLQPGNPAEGRGVAIAAVTDDFDGQTRGALTPSDIGADAGDFTWMDSTAPTISYPLLSSSSTANRVLTSWATITDGVGVASGANAPRLYYKKSTDADVFSVANDSTGNGWKYVTATGSGPYSFTLDYSIINGGSVSIGDTIQYFVVAQDAANNLVSSPAFATASANPPGQNVNAHGAVNSFSIVPLLSGGTVAVGSGGTYPNLSGTGGLFAALNGAVLTGNLVVNITSDVTETGGVMLNEFNTVEYPDTGNYTLTLRPDSATMRTLSGSVDAGLITLSGADRVTIDGSFGGSGRYLTLRNTSAEIFSSASTLLFVNDASSNTVRNCILEGATTNTTVGVIGFGIGAVTGNDNNLVTDCQVRDLSTATGVPLYLIGSTGSVGTYDSPTFIANSGNTISNNDLFNFNGVGIYITKTGNESWTLSGNNIHQATAATEGGVGIDMQGGGTNVIQGNYIHDLLTTGSQISCIYFNSLNGTTTIARNRITVLNVNAATTTVHGIHIGGYAVPTLNLINNQIVLSPATPRSTSIVGLYYGLGGGEINTFYNSLIIGGTETGSANSWVALRDVSSYGMETARNNLFLNLRTGGTGGHFAAGIFSSSGSYIVSNNVYAGTGTTAANFMYYSGGAGNLGSMDFATWQSSTGDTNSQAGIAGTGSFNAAMFVNATNGDLHLVPGGNAWVNSTGIPIAGVTDDFDGDPRPSSAPSIGSDQIPFADIAVAQAFALTDNASSVDLGELNVGGSSAALTFTITNPGTADLTGLAVSADGANAADFTVSALGSTSVPAGSGSVTFTVTFSPGAGGARNAAIRIASNVSGAKNPFDIALTGNGLVTQSAWRQMWFGTTANSGNGADTFDFDRDGLANVLEYAFGLNPTQNSAGQLLTGQIVGSNFVISFTQPDDVTGITYGAEWSNALTGTWSPITDTGAAPQHTFSLPVSSGTNVFVRLKVTAAP